MILLCDLTLNKDFLNFRKAHSCYSMSGRNGGAQTMSLATFCAEETTLIHEVYFVNFQQSTLQTILLDSAFTRPVT